MSSSDRHQHTEIEYRQRRTLLQNRLALISDRAFRSGTLAGLTFRDAVVGPFLPSEPEHSPDAQAKQVFKFTCEWRVGIFVSVRRATEVSIFDSRIENVTVRHVMGESSLVD